jgi:hypothetical protein
VIELPDLPPNASEIASARAICAKTFDLGEGKRRLILASVPLHRPRDVAAYFRGERVDFDDIDDTLDEGDDDDLVLRRGLYSLRILKRGVGFTYQSIITGSILRVRLLEIDGNAVGAVGLPERVGKRLIWRDVAPGNDFHLLLRTQNVELFKVIKNANAGRRFRWRVIESADRGIWGPDKDLKTRGWDNADGNDPQRLDDLARHAANNTISGPGRFRRTLVMADPVKGPEDSTSTPGFVTYQFLERWTGGTVARDPVTRVPSVSSDVVYPCAIDVLVTENIGATADDGFQTMSNGNWVPGGYGGTGDLIIYDPGGAGNRYLPGWRFTSVGIPQGTVTDDATLTITGRVNSSGSGAAATVYGWAHDNAPAWANGAGPGNATKTTASVSFGAWGGSQANPTTKNLNVKGPVDEIVGRAGFAGGALALLVDFTETNNSAFHYFDDLTGGGSPAVLTANYTAGGGGSVNISSALTAGPDSVSGSMSVAVSITAAPRELADRATSGAPAAVALPGSLRERPDQVALTAGAVATTIDSAVRELPDASTAALVEPVAVAAALLERPDAVTASATLATAITAALREKPDAAATAAVLAISITAAVREYPDRAAVALAEAVAISGAPRELADAIDILAGGPAVTMGAALREGPDSSAGAAAVAVSITASIQEQIDRLTASAVAPHAITATVIELPDRGALQMVTAVSASAALREGEMQALGEMAVAVAAQFELRELSDALLARSVLVVVEVAGGIVVELVLPARVYPLVLEARSFSLALDERSLTLVKP